jgi:hypothetical protein
MFDVCTTGDTAHIDTHIYDIQVLATHTSTWVQGVPPLTRDRTDLKARIISAVKNIDASMLTRVWQELEYRIDMCHVTHGAHIENL